MNSPRAQEMDKLQRIQSQVQGVAHKIHQRLPHQRTALASLVCALRWRLRTAHALHTDAYTAEMMEAVAKRVRMEVGTFEYAAKEQGELLTRYLCELDNILSHGNSEIKEARKALVVEIQRLLEQADAVKTSATKFKAFALRVIDNLPPATTTTEDVSMEVEASEPASEETTTATEPAAALESDDEQTKLLPVFDEDVDIKDAGANIDDAKQAEAVPIDAESDGDEDEDAMNDDEDEEENQEDVEGEEEASTMEDDAVAQPHTITSACEAEEEEHESLPVWRPYYHIQKRPDGVYLIANLHGVDPRCLRVQTTPREGLLRIAGAKFPTQKDMLLSRLSGAPTYGRFEIVERFPVGVLALEHASQQLLRDGALQVRLPYAVRPQRRVVRRVSPFMMPGLAW